MFAGAGGLAWLIIKWLSTEKRSTLLGSASGVVSGLVGIFGAIATGFLANPDVNGEAGLFCGNPGQVLPQLIAVGATIVFAGLGLSYLFKFTTFITGGGRIGDTLEDQGMDVGYHGEESFHTEE